MVFNVVFENQLGKTKTILRFVIALCKSLTAFFQNLTNAFDTKSNTDLSLGGIFTHLIFCHVQIGVRDDLYFELGLQFFEFIFQSKGF